MADKQNKKASTAMGFSTENGGLTPHSYAATDDAIKSLTHIFVFVKEATVAFERIVMQIPFWFAVMRKYQATGARGFDAESPAHDPKAYFHTSRGRERG